MNRLLYTFCVKVGPRGEAFSSQGGGGGGGGHCKKFK